MSAPRLVMAENHAPSFISHRRPLMRAAMRAGYDVHVVLPSGESTTALRDDGAEVHTVPLERHGRSLIFDAGTLAHFVALLRRLRPTIVHLTTIKPILYGTIAARIAGAKGVVASFTGLGHPFQGAGARAHLRRQLFVGACRSVLDSASVRALFQNRDDLTWMISRGAVSAAFARLIRSAGVDTAAYLPRPEPPGDPVVILPARMIASKGIHELVEAARLLRREGPRARFVLCGPLDPTAPGAISGDELRRWQSAGDIEWWGHRSDMASALGASHVVCLPSRASEGVPRVLLEAASCERAVVTTHSPGCRDAVVDGQTGLLVPPRDSRALAVAIAALLSDPARRRSMGERGRRRAVAEFSTDQVAAETLAVYRELEGG